MVTLVPPLNLPAGLLRGSGKTRNGEIGNGKREMSGNGIPSLQNTLHFCN